MSFTLIKVGNKDRPATQEDLEDIKSIIRKAKADKTLSIVTHHAIEFSTVQTYDGHVTVYKVGDDQRPANGEDIIWLQKELNEATEEKRPVVSHHSITVEYVKL